jgi:hypothetical protein
MKFNKLAFLGGFVITAILFAEVAVHADETDQTTKLTFNEPVEIPGHVLPAGTYLFKLADQNDMNMVQIFNADGTRVYATLPTISAQRSEPPNNTVLIMAEPDGGRPVALLKWFYPGNTIGHEFVYPKQEEQQIAQDRQQTMVVKQTAESGD